ACGAGLAASTGEFEREYEGELKGAEMVGRELIKAAVANVADGYLSHLETRKGVEGFDRGGTLQLGGTISTKEVLSHAREVQGLIELAHAAGIPKEASPPLLAAGGGFFLVGGRPREDKFRDEERTIPSIPQGKKKYYN